MIEKKKRPAIIEAGMVDMEMKRIEPHFSRRSKTDGINEQFTSGDVNDHSIKV